jgi:hypothetical protein
MVITQHGRYSGLGWLNWLLKTVTHHNDDNVVHIQAVQPSNIRPIFWFRMVTHHNDDNVVHIQAVQPSNIRARFWFRVVTHHNDDNVVHIQAVHPSNMRARFSMLVASRIIKSTCSATLD